MEEVFLRVFKFSFRYHYSTIVLNLSITAPRGADQEEHYRTFCPKLGSSSLNWRLVGLVFKVLFLIRDRTETCERASQANDLAPLQTDIL
jgi:hypothetical protein